MTAGRPSKYEPWMLDEIEPLMSEGASLNEVAAAIGICRETLHQWSTEGSEYYIAEISDAIKRGKELSLAWWEKQGRVNLKDKDFSPTLWYMNMKNRHGWRDKQDVELTGGSFNLTIKK